MTPEGRIKDLVKKVLKKYEPDVWWFMPIGGPYAAKGTPDFIICAKGEFIAVETKAPGKKPTALQAKCHKEISTADGMVFVIDSEEWVEVLDNYIKEVLHGKGMF